MLVDGGQSRGQTGILLAGILLLAGIRFGLVVRMSSVLVVVRATVMPTQMKVRSRRMIFWLGKSAAGVHVPEAQALIGQQQRNEQEAEELANHRTKALPAGLPRLRTADERTDVAQVHRPLMAVNLQS